MPKSIQDTIKFVLTAEGVVVSTTAKVTATMAATLTQELTEAKLKDALRDTTAKFIPNIEFQFSNMVRTTDTSGLEKVTVTATARVPEAEYYALDRRSREASVEGLRITSVTADTSPTSIQVEEIQSKLRLELLAKARTEMAAINKALDEKYRLGEVVFNPEAEEFTASNRGSKAMAMSYGTGFDHNPSGGGAIGNAVKLTMTAEVTLRISRDTK